MAEDEVITLDVHDGEESSDSDTSGETHHVDAPADANNEDESDE